MAEEINMDPDRILTRSSDILSNEVGGETVMISVEKGNYYSLNATGNYIWKILEAPMPVADILSHLRSAFNLSDEQCRDEVMPFIEKMIKQGILV